MVEYNLRQYRPDYTSAPSRELTAAARELSEVTPGVELGSLTDKGVFDLAWKALDRFCRADVEDYARGIAGEQSDEEKSAILAGLGSPEAIDPKEIIAKFDTIYKTAVSGLYWVLSRGRNGAIPEELASQFGSVTNDQISQTLPGAYPGFIQDQLIREHQEAKSEGDKFFTGTVTTDIVRSRMWQILDSSEELSHYKKFMASPDEIAAKLDVVRAASSKDAQP